MLLVIYSCKNNIVYSENYDLYTLILVSLDRFPMTLFVTKATPFITNYSVHIELPQVINEYHYNSFNYSYSIHILLVKASYT